jgi:hypothetical protein
MLVGIDPSDPATTWRGIEFQVHALSRREIFAGNLLHCLLAFATLAWMATHRKELPLAGSLALGLIGGLVLLSALLQWQVWSSRLHLPLFVIGSAVLAMVLVRVGKPTLIGLVCGAFFLSALMFSLMNELRPLAARKFARTIWAHSRAELYVADSHADMAEALVATVQFVKQSGCREIGLDLTMEPFEYPVMGLLNAGHEVQVRTVGVVNPTTTYTSHRRDPVCAVICLGCARVKQKWLQYRSMGEHAAVFNEAAVFTATGDLPNTVAAEADTRDARVIAEDTEQIYRQLRASDVPTADDIFEPVRGRHPSEAFELSARYQDLSRWKVVALVMWENTGEVLRKARQQQPLSSEEYGLLVTTNEALHYWQQHYPERAHEAEEKAFQLDALTRAGTP